MFVVTYEVEFQLRFHYLFTCLIVSRKKQDDKISVGDEHAGEASSRQILRISGPSLSLSLQTLGILIFIYRSIDAILTVYFYVVVDQSVEKQQEAIRSVFSGFSLSLSDFLFNFALFFCQRYFFCSIVQ